MSDLTYGEVRALISRLSGGENFIGIPRPLLAMVKDHVAALVLNQALFYMNEADADGWVNRSHEQWQADVFVSAYQLRRAFEALKPFGLETKLKKVGRGPTLHFRINSEVFVKELRQHFVSKETQQTRPIVKKLDNQETSQTLSDAVSEEIRQTKNSTNVSQETAQTIDKDKNLREEQDSQSIPACAERLLAVYSETVRPVENLHVNTRNAWKTLIRVRLQEGWTEAQLAKAFKGCSLDDWKDRWRWNKVTDILKDRDSIEQFITYADEMPKRAQGNGKTTAHPKPNYGKPPVTRDFSKYPSRS